MLPATLLFFSGCHAENRYTSKEQPKPQIEGYGGIKFGDSFLKVIGTAPTGIFNPLYVRDCLETLPLRGCALDSDSDGYRYFTVVDGIPYKLNVQFNRHDAATDISLIYNKEGDISQQECVDIHLRTLDWLLKKYGLFAYRRPGGAHFIFRGAVTETQKRQLNRLIDGSGLVFDLARTVLTIPNWNMAPNQWGNSRYAELSSSYIVVDGSGICNLEVGFREPIDVERPTVPASSAPPTAKSVPKIVEESRMKDNVEGEAADPDNSPDD